MKIKNKTKVIRALRMLKKRIGGYNVFLCLAINDMYDQCLIQTHIRNQLHELLITYKLSFDEITSHYLWYTNCDSPLERGGWWEWESNETDSAMIQKRKFLTLLIREIK